VTVAELIEILKEFPSEMEVWSLEEEYGDLYPPAVSICGVRGTEKGQAWCSGDYPSDTKKIDYRTAVVIGT
jgi:hypothetical protein